MLLAKITYVGANSLHYATAACRLEPGITKQCTRAHAFFNLNFLKFCISKLINIYRKKHFLKTQQIRVPSNPTPRENLHEGALPPLTFLRIA